MPGPPASRRTTNDRAPAIANPPWGPLRFLYVGSSDTPRDAAWYVEKAGAVKLWQFEAFGAIVAGLRLGEGPLWLLADHRPPGSILPIWECGPGGLKATVQGLVARGWEPHGEPFEVPTGPCRLLRDPSGTELCLTETTRSGWPGE